MDRWYAQFQLFDDIVAANNSYVCRVRDNSSYQILEQRELTAEARTANITFNAVVALGDKPERLRIQAYCTIIACMLLNFWTNRKSTKATLEIF